VVTKAQCRPCGLWFVDHLSLPWSLWPWPSHCLLPVWVCDWSPSISSSGLYLSSSSPCHWSPSPHLSCVDLLQWNRVFVACLSCARSLTHVLCTGLDLWLVTFKCKQPLANIHGCGWYGSGSFSVFLRPQSQDSLAHPESRLVLVVCYLKMLHLKETSKTFYVYKSRNGIAKIICFYSVMEYQILVANGFIQKVVPDEYSCQFWCLTN